MCALGPGGHPSLLRGVNKVPGGRGAPWWAVVMGRVGLKECPPSGSQVPGAGPRGTPRSPACLHTHSPCSGSGPRHAPVTPNCLPFFTCCRQLLILVTLSLCPLCQDGTHSFPLRLTPPHPGLTGGTLTPIPPQPARQGASLGLSLCPGAGSPAPCRPPVRSPPSARWQVTKPSQTTPASGQNSPRFLPEAPVPSDPPQPPPRPALAPFPRAGSRLCPGYPEPLPLHLRAFVLAVLSARYPPPPPPRPPQAPAARDSIPSSTLSHSCGDKDLGTYLPALPWDHLPPSPTRPGAPCCVHVEPETSNTCCVNGCRNISGAARSGAFLYPRGLLWGWINGGISPPSPPCSPEVLVRAPGPSPTGLSPSRRGRHPGTHGTGTRASSQCQGQCPAEADTMEPPAELPLTGHLGQGEPSPGRRSLPPELLRPSWSSRSWASSGHLGTTASDSWDALRGPGGGSLQNSLCPCPMLASSLSLPVEGLVPPSFHKRSQRQPLQGLRAPSSLPRPPVPWPVPPCLVATTFLCLRTNSLSLFPLNLFTAVLIPSCVPSGNPLRTLLEGQVGMNC